MIINRIYIAYLLSYIFFLLEYEMVDLLHFNKCICPQKSKKIDAYGIKK